MNPEAIFEIVSGTVVLTSAILVGLLSIYLDRHHGIPFLPMFLSSLFLLLTATVVLHMAGVGA